MKTKRQMFTTEEDEKLKKLVAEFGTGNWRIISDHLPNRTPRQCRERYRNYLAPEIVNGTWTVEEDQLLRMKFQEYGPKWAIISNFFPTRSEINIKNRWAVLGKRFNMSFKYFMKQQLLSRNSHNHRIPTVIEKPVTLAPSVVEEKGFDSMIDIFEFNDTIQEIDMIYDWCY